MRSFRRLLGLLLLLGCLPARAEVLVLVHGYLGNANSWAQAGVIRILDSRGHKLAGTYYPSAKGVALLGNGSESGQPVYTVNLPSMLPVALQADWLALYLRDIAERHPDDTITLAAHSAGGVVARMLLVRNRPDKVSHLITIAAPHLGTLRANQALDAVDDGGFLGPLHRWVVRRRTGRFLYHTLKASRGLLFDLTPPRPGNLLYWLNRQPHPDIRYTSIIRVGSVRMPGDRIVPPFSQDMRQLQPLADRARSYQMAQGHLLTPQDGHLLANLLQQAPEEP